MQDTPPSGSFPRPNKLMLLLRTSWKASVFKLVFASYYQNWLTLVLDHEHRSLSLIRLKSYTLLS